MIKKGILLIGLLTAWNVQAQDVNHYTPGTMEEGVVYYLPKTQIEIQVTATKVTYTPGDAYQTVTLNTSAATRTIRIVVKAGDGSSRVYTLSFEVEKSANALLKMIYLDGDGVRRTLSF